MELWFERDDAVIGLVEEGAHVTDVADDLVVKKIEGQIIAKHFLCETLCLEIYIEESSPARSVHTAS